mmetsp:Transcript_159172/g.510541  ORF Transcript_159172/g.510541 Transcript_159172/m.510541 type:complete len:509 (-) Transcript_159172:1297-2823(-)
MEDIHIGEPSRDVRWCRSAPLRPRVRAWCHPHLRGQQLRGALHLEDGHWRAGAQAVRAHRAGVPLRVELTGAPLGHRGDRHGRCRRLRLRDGCGHGELDPKDSAPGPRCRCGMAPEARRGPGHCEPGWHCPDLQLRRWPGWHGWQTTGHFAGSHCPRLQRHLPPSVPRFGRVRERRQDRQDMELQPALHRRARDPDFGGPHEQRPGSAVAQRVAVRTLQRLLGLDNSSLGRGHREVLARLLRAPRGRVWLGHPPAAAVFLGEQQPRYDAPLLDLRGLGAVAARAVHRGARAPGRASRRRPRGGHGRDGRARRQRDPAAEEVVRGTQQGVVGRHPAASRRWRCLPGAIGSLQENLHVLHVPLGYGGFVGPLGDDPGRDLATGAQGSRGGRPKGLPRARAGGLPEVQGLGACLDEGRHGHRREAGGAPVEGGADHVACRRHSVVLPLHSAGRPLGACNLHRPGGQSEVLGGFVQRVYRNAQCNDRYRGVRAILDSHGEGRSPHRCLHRAF